MKLRLHEFWEEMVKADRRTFPGITQAFGFELSDTNSLGNICEAPGPAQKSKPKKKDFAKHKYLSVALTRSFSYLQFNNCSLDFLGI